MPARRSTAVRRRRADGAARRRASRLNPGFPYEYGIDLTPLRAAGAYRVLVGSGAYTSSPLFRIAFVDG